MALSRITNPFLSSSGAGNAGITSPSANTIAFSTTTAERMRIDSSGNLGIGTNSPSTYANSYAPVLVTGTGNNWATIQGRTDGPSGVSNGVSFGGSYSTNPINGSRIWLGASGSGGQQGQILFYTKNTDDNINQPTERMRIDSSGNVGIGTSSPGYKLDVQSSASSGAPLMANFQSAGGDPQMYISNGTIKTQLTADATNSASIVGSFSNHPLIIRTNNTERMRIDTSGNLIVGSSVSTTAVGQINVYAAASTKTEIYMQRLGQVEGHIGFLGSTNSNWYFNTSATLGNTGVYMTNNGTAWTSNSDERLKTDLVAIENAAEKVSSLRAVTGRYKTDPEGTSRAFLIAQDVQKVLPEAISETEIEGDDTVYYGVAYTDTIPLLVAAIKEQQALITALTARIEALESK